MNPRFKPGDRVRMRQIDRGRKNSWVPAGQHGTVVDQSRIPLVEWDNHFSFMEHGNLWCALDEQLEHAEPLNIDGDTRRKEW